VDYHREADYSALVRERWRWNKSIVPAEENEYM